MRLLRAGRVGAVLVVVAVMTVGGPGAVAFAAVSSSPPMVFASSADPTRQSLFVAQATTPEGPHGAVRELTTAATTTLTAIRALLVDTSQFNPPSPDPSGIAYLPQEDRLVIVDSEVEEMSVFNDANLYSMTRAGALQETGLTTAYSNEPTGIAYDPASGHAFISDDYDKRVYEVAPGSDGRLGTSDDQVTFISTTDFGQSDTEDVAYDTKRNVVYTADGTGREVWAVTPGPNGRFDGADDQVTHFDVAALGVDDLEGIAYHPQRDTLFLVDREHLRLLEVSITGALVGTIDISTSGLSKPAGATVAPASDGSGTLNLWVTDRGEDNDGNSKENDGKVAEISM